MTEDAGHPDLTLPIGGHEVLWDMIFKGTGVRVRCQCQTVYYPFRRLLHFARPDQTMQQILARMRCKRCRVVASTENARLYDERLEQAASPMPRGMSR